MLSQLKSRIRSFCRRWGGASNASFIRIEFYTRAGCCLCDDALQIIERARRRYSIEIQTFDIDQSPDLRARYGSLVPVVVVNGRERFHGRVNRVLLDRLLAAEANQG